MNKEKKVSRLEYTGRNVALSTIANILYSLLGMLGRYAFLCVLDETYLGISSLYSSIIGALSAADLGLITAFTFCFYKPIAENDISHIQALLSAFRKVTACIAAFILTAGLAIIPFLRSLVKGGENISDGMLVLYYLISLTNTVLSYWIMHKTCYITACQKAYYLVPYRIAANFATVLLQILVLFVFKKYAPWAMCGVLVSAVQYIVMNKHIKAEFPETNVVETVHIPEEDKKSIMQNVKAAIMQNIGYISVAQTDSIIVSSMISVSTAGLLSNYEMLKNSVVTFASIFQNAVLPGLGNLIASEDKEVQKNVLYTYMVLNYCIVGFMVCGIGVLSSPFISLIFGAQKTIDELTVTLMCVGFYFSYQSYALTAFPTAAGKMILGAWVALLQGISNLIISIAAVKVMGLPGVYVGTVVSQFINYFIRPFPIFRGIFGETPYRYFRNTLLYFASTMLAYGILWVLRIQILGTSVTILNFALLTLLTPVVFFGTAWILWGRTKYGQEALGIIRKSLNIFLKKK